MQLNVGKQLNGSSDYDIKLMALNATNDLQLQFDKLTAADIGCGQGDFSKLLAINFKNIFALDSFGASFNIPNVEKICCDLNKDWPLEDMSIDSLYSLEVIEHVENPRHFFREIHRVLKPKGFCFISSPNNLTIYSRIIFLMKGEHRYFQDKSYPAHITPILHKDLQRIASETGFTIKKWYYNNSDKLPFFNKKINLPGKLFSKNFGVLLFKKQEVLK